MKSEQISEHVWSLKSWLGIPVTAWVVVEEDGVTLVDAGMPWMAKGILRFLEQLNAGPLKKILLTHGHADHVGSVKKIRAVYPVPVYAHEVEIPFLQGDVVYPKRKKAERNLPPGLTQALASDTEGELAMSAGLRPYFTPGHSPGHVVYYHEQDGVLLAGDLFTSKQGKLHRPMPLFTADMGEALRSSRVIEKLNPKRVEVCHGNPVFDAANHLEEYIAKTAAAYSVTGDVLV